ncbi:MAG: SDR family oxidoreductase [Acidimicrobiia bacterium]|nr:SDR family oxidoreductase [Acidimicrobiia bacterium]
MAVVLLTGCSTGFGRLSALRFARSGDTVVATMRDPSPSSSKAAELHRARDEEGLALELVPLDVTDDASVEAAVSGAVERHGGIDVLVNNAGLGISGAVEEVTDGDARSVFETNVFGAMRVTRAALPAMRAAGRGVIVNVSSVAGRVTPPFGGWYSASKYALEALSEALHFELGPFGIRVVLIEPGGFPTEFDTNRMDASASTSAYADLEERWDKAYGNLPGRDGTPADPEDVAAAIQDAATDPATPLRRLVGADAEMIGALRADLDDAAFERTIRGALDFWDGAGPLVREGGLS